MAEREQQAKARLRQYGVNAIVRVGRGRGFVVETHECRRLIITAAHCLPRLPKRASFLGEEERCFPRLLGLLDEKPWALACCVFADPIADLAALGGVDFDETFGELVDSVRPLRVAQPGPPDAPHAVRMLGLDGAWFDGEARHLGGGLWLGGIGVADDVGKPAAGLTIRKFAGLSGSPILDARGGAIAVFVTGGSCEPHGPQPALDPFLPVGLWRELFGGKTQRPARQARAVRADIVDGVFHLRQDPK